MKTVSRSAGRSATAAAAYRAAVEIADERTGLVHDYSRKSG
ncbi:MobA/MobL family protein, partial [Sphingobium scionense]